MSNLKITKTETKTRIHNTRFSAIDNDFNSKSNTEKKNTTTTYVTNHLHRRSTSVYSGAASGAAWSTREWRQRLNTTTRAEVQLSTEHGTHNSTSSTSNNQLYRLPLSSFPSLTCQLLLYCKHIMKNLREIELLC